MKTKSLRQWITFKVSPHEVYEALMIPASIPNSGCQGQISRTIGGKILLTMTMLMA